MTRTVLLFTLISAFAACAPTPLGTAVGGRIMRRVMRPETQHQADALLVLFDDMPRVPVYVTAAPFVEEGEDYFEGVAITECLPGNVPEITVKGRFIQNANDVQTTNILKHELTHAWFCRQGIRAGHDERFRKKFESIGGFGN